MRNGSTLNRSDRIRVLNDNFRSSLVGGRVCMTTGVNELPMDVKAKALLRVQSFDDFTNGNDPYGEHDFGSFEIAGVKFFWKIDYYGNDMMLASSDPADPGRTIRVLTIMLAEEY